MNIAGENVRMISNGDGRTHLFLLLPQWPARALLIDISWREGVSAQSGLFSQGYVWAVYPTFDIFTARPDGSDVKTVDQTPGYDAENNHLARRQTRVHLNARW